MPDLALVWQHDYSMTGSALNTICGLVCPVPGIVRRSDLVGDLLGFPVYFPKTVPSPYIDEQGTC